MLVYALIALAVGYHELRAPGASPRGMPSLLWITLTTFVIPLAGSGVRSQAPVGFPEGLAGSTEFTIALPVSRARLLAVRALIGWLEVSVVTLLVACVAWSLFPAVQASILPADYARVVFTKLVFLTGPYYMHVLYTALMDELPALMYSGWSLALLLWLLHRAPPGVDIIRAFTEASPLVTHRVPWPQIATSLVLALNLPGAAVRAVRTREY